MGFSELRPRRVAGLVRTTYSKGNTIMTRRAKIVCTMGPATSSEEGIAALLDAGMNVARMNFSHGEHADHEQVHFLLRAAAKSADKALAILADLQGPKIRLGRFEEGPHDWPTGEQVTITVEDIVGSRNRVSTTYRGLAQDARPGDRLLIDDGKVGLVVTQVAGSDVICSVTEGGPVSNNKGISLPGMNVSVPAMSEKDIGDLKFALSLGVDVVALSFVRSASDVDLVKQVMDEAGAARVPSSRRSRSPKLSPISTRSCWRSTGSWWPAAISAWSCRWSRCRWCRSGRCRSPGRTRSR